MKLSYSHQALLISLSVLISCQSHNYKTVTVTDEVSNKTSAENKQNLEDARQILAKGNLSFQKGKFEDSIEKANEANAKFESAEGYSLLGASEYQLGEYKAAKDAYVLGERLDPLNEKLLIGLGTVQSTLGEYEDAVITYEKLIKIKPEEPIYKYKVGTLLKLQRKFQESYVILKPLEDDKTFPYPIELLNQLGDVCLELKKYDEAESYFAKSEKLQPDLKSAQNAKQSTKIAASVQKGNDAISKKNYDLAIAEYKKATELQPTNASLWTFLGNAYFLKGLYPDSEASFRKSISLQDNYSNGYLGLCNVLIKNKNYSECLKVSEQGLRKSPRNAELKNKQGICEWRWGQTQKAILSFQDAASWDKVFFEPQINLAYLLIDQARNEEAIEVLKKAGTHPHANKEDLKKALTIAESQVHIVEGDKFLRQGKRKHALEEYGRALGRSPEDPGPHNAFGKAYYAFGEEKKSESAYKEALRIDSDNLMAIQGLARLYAKTGESKKEKEFVKKLEKLSADDPYAAITMGRIAEDAGKFDDAENIYNSLKKKFPENDAINYRLGNLFYKRAVEENEKENYTKAMDYVHRSRKFTKEIPEVLATEKTIQENMRFAEIVPSVREANKLFDKKKFDDAIVLYQKAYDKIQKPALLVKIAESYMGKGEEEKGISILEKAAKEDKNQASSFREGIFAFFYKKGEISKAEEGFNAILREKPDSFYSYYMLGLIGMNKKDYESSINQLDKSILLNGSFAPSNVAKGLALYKLGQPDPAKKEFEKARAKDSEFSLSSYNLAIAYFNEDLPTESKSILEALKKSDPDFTDGEIHLAYLYFKEGKLNEAEASISNVLKEERSAEALYAHFVILDAKNKTAPSEKLKVKKSSIQKEIWRDYPDSKYARLLPTDTNEDDSIIITEVHLNGSPVERPILYPNRIIINYGTSLVGLDRQSKEQVWKNYTPESYAHLIGEKQLLAFRPGRIQRIYPDSGKFGIMVPLPNSDSILKVDAHSENLFLLTENEKTKERMFQVLDWDGSKVYELKGKDLLTFGITKQGTYVLVKEHKKEFIFLTAANGNWGSQSKPTLLLKKDQHEKALVIGCLLNSCLLRIGNTNLEVHADAKIVSLPSAGHFSNYYEADNSIYLKSAEKFFVWKEGGKWKEILASDGDFHYPISDTIFEAKAKEIQLTRGKFKKSHAWSPEKDGKRLTTITLD